MELHRNPDLRERNATKSITALTIATPNTTASTGLPNSREGVGLVVGVVTERKLDSSDPHVHQNRESHCQIAERE